mmetsp:Transcript_7977/g.17828  ORF Transcript_7977/g.17828 Transcript_7977/m.17828 type:complete len:277 (-) Transcript_7977:1012-1842(-)
MSCRKSLRRGRSLQGEQCRCRRRVLNRFRHGHLSFPGPTVHFPGCSVCCGSWCRDSQRSARNSSIPRWTRSDPSPAATRPQELIQHQRRAPSVLLPCISLGKPLEALRSVDPRSPLHPSWAFVQNSSWPLPSLPTLPGNLPTPVLSHPWPSFGRFRRPLALTPQESWHEEFSRPHANGVWVVSTTAFGCDSGVSSAVSVLAQGASLHSSLRRGPPECGGPNSNGQCHSPHAGRPCPCPCRRHGCWCGFCCFCCCYRSPHSPPAPPPLPLAKASGPS